uniref:CD59 glycoprotein n=1 Tax=Pongo abelii TaxID=9601 RepID=A0A8I5TMP6_PONAB
MGIQGGSVLFGLLLILAVFCHSGHSLQCYSCPNPTADCKTAVNCSSGFDACLITKADTHPLRGEGQDSYACSYELRSVVFQALHGIGVGISLCCPGPQAILSLQPPKVLGLQV